MAVVDGVREELSEPTCCDDLEQLREEQRALTKEIGRLTTAIAAGGDMPSLLEARAPVASRSDHGDLSND